MCVTQNVRFSASRVSVIDKSFLSHGYSRVSSVKVRLPLELITITAKYILTAISTLVKCPEHACQQRVYIKQLSSGAF